jgi:NAD(P)H-dependent FMN reductase
MSKLQIIIGSTRPDRAADLVAPWVIGTARTHGEFDVEVLDLRDWPLPMFAETRETVGNFNDPTYSTPSVRSCCRVWLPVLRRCGKDRTSCSSQRVA